MPGCWLKRKSRFNYNQSRNCTGITSGWKHFAVDNNLELFDVCIFDPCNLENSPFRVDVKIFRVVLEVAPLTPVESPKSGMAGRKTSNSVEIEDDELINED
ncbi:hypothetical protein TIFTF001_002722 [Ficus carica]|uniref:TF-B3 domain-containing protein n=1 Tax=Ficus carica TaxID=3494 RepID=A0AA87ZP95_FICCA|nr:hypothetical protein TIFTF001_002722 [Ficus carica]